MGKSVLCPKAREVGTIVTLPSLWDNAPKVHMSVYNDISARLLSIWTFQDIYTEVDKSDIQDDDDKLATTRALCLLRDRRRQTLQNA